MTYKFLDGSRVRTAPRANGGTEFTTYSPAGEVIATVVKHGDAASALRDLCFMADAVRFVKVYGGKGVIARA